MTCTGPGNFFKLKSVVFGRVLAYFPYTNQGQIKVNHFFPQNLYSSFYLRKMLFWIANSSGVRCYRGLYTPPPKKHGSVEASGTQTMLSPNFEKKCGNPPPPEGWSSGGFPHFFSKIGDNMVWGGETFLKNWSKRGCPYLGHFLAILVISGENCVPDWSP